MKKDEVTVEEEKMTNRGFPNWPRTDQDECLIVEELCRVIAGADRFQTCVEAWKAILTVRRIAGGIKKEITELCSSGPDEAAAIRAGDPEPKERGPDEED